MNWELIDENRYNILKKVINNISLNNYYLARGTAIALQTGIRESFDLISLLERNLMRKI